MNNERVLRTIKLRYDVFKIFVSTFRWRLFIIKYSFFIKKDR